jgi:2-keto-4-pentenoate hydratase/2-oxohepta-3-ene-1,7-dioic acid hydratase in catechol pathway
VTSLRFGGRWLRPGKIVCVARNYPSHAKEMAAEVPPEPVFFLKPTTALLASGGTVVLPPQSQRVEVETELAVILAGGGRDVPRERAMDAVLGYAVVFDITARDLQAEAKAKGLPWAVAKGFDTFAPISEVAPAATVGDPDGLSIRLEGNGEVWQDGNTREMVHKVPDLIHHASRVMTLQRGDVIATGTPAGVHEIRDKDVLVGTIERVGRLEARVSRRGKA